MPAFDFSGYSNKNYSSPTTSNNSGDNRRENYRNTPAAKTAAVKAATISKTNKIKNDKTAFNNLRYTQSDTILGKIANTFGIGEKSFNANKSYYEKNVIGKNNFTRSVDSYKDYMKKRGSGEIDSMGRTKRTGSGSDNNNVINEVTKNAPTVAEVSQVTTADAAAEDTEANRLLKIKKRGRSKSILSGSQGVTKMASDYTLGVKNLLGRV
jgi:hypothetical protein